MRKYAVIAAFAIVLFIPVRARAFCHGISQNPAPITPQGHVCGTVERFGFNGTNFLYKPAGQSYVKMCRAGTNMCETSTITSTHTDAWGGPVQAFTFYRFAYGWPEEIYLYYDFYAWGTSGTDYWGSSTNPIRKNIGVGYTGNEGIRLTMPPRPLEPATVYPSGTNVGNSYTVRWKSGRDTDRPTYYNIRYEVWYKYWPFGSSEPANFILSRADMPCHDNGSNVPNSSNECTTYVAGPQPAGNWKWYVVANLDASAYFYPGTITTTQSSERSFVQPNP